MSCDKKDPEITVVTTFFNAERTIRDTIASIISEQTLTTETIFVDGNSTDGTLNVVKANYENFANAVVISEPDRGIYDGMNKGIRRAKGDVIAILNADDAFEPGAIAKVLMHFNEAPEIEILAGSIRKVDFSGAKGKVYTRSLLPKLGPRSSIIHHPAVFVRSSLYKRIGCFDLRYSISADYDFISRAINSGAKIKYIDDVLVNMREGGISDSFKFHLKKNIEHLLIGYRNLRKTSDRVAHTYYVAKKFLYGVFLHFRIIKRD
ncbi:MAG: glycosyltransferase family 2 protein [Reinekea sp.]